MKPLADLTDDELLHVARQAMTLEDAPEPVVQAAIALWPVADQGSLAGSVARLAGGLLDAGVRRLRAVLETDSAAPGFAHGLRSAPSATRHLLFSVDGIDIDLRIAAGAQGHDISGQVLGPEEGGRVELRAPGADPAGEPLLQARLDAFGEFRLEAVTLAAGAITLVLPAGVVDLPAIDFGPATG